jgi:hypothetical protein
MVPVRASCYEGAISVIVAAPVVPVDKVNARVDMRKLVDPFTGLAAQRCRPAVDGV